MDFEEKESKQNKIKRYTNLLIKMIITILTLLLIFQIYIIISGNYKFKIFNINYNLIYVLNNYKTILIIEMICFIMLIVIIKNISYFYIDKLEWKYIKYFLKSIDNNSVIHLNLKDEIIDGDLKTEGCKKRKNKYNIDLPKYKCSIRRFDEQELMGYSHILTQRISLINNNDRGGPSLPNFKFFTLDSVAEYAFEMSDKTEYYPFLYENLSKKFNDISILDDKIIIKYHFYDNSINESNHEYFNNFYNYDFTVNVFQKDDNDNIISVIEKAKIMYFEIYNQIMENDINGNKN